MRSGVRVPSVALFAVAFCLGGLLWTSAQEPPPAAPVPDLAIDIAADGTPIPGGVNRPTSGTMGLLRRLEQRHDEVKTVWSTFKQTKVSEIFQETISSEGQLWFEMPDRFRCDYEDELISLIVGNTIWMYVPANNQVEILRYESDEERDQQLHSIVLGFGFKTEEMIRSYEIHSSEDEPFLIDEIREAGLELDEVVLLQLEPVPERLDTSPFTKLKLWIDRETLLPDKVWYEDYNGDNVTITLLDPVLNRPIEKEIFEAARIFPAGVEVIDRSPVR